MPVRRWAATSLCCRRTRHPKGNIPALEKAFVEVSTQEDGTTQNEYFERTAAIVHTRGHVGTDPYGKPARVFLHDGGMDAIAADLKWMLDKNLSENLDLDLYLRFSPVRELRELIDVRAESLQEPHRSGAGRFPCRGRDIP